MRQPGTRKLVYDKDSRSIKTVRHNRIKWLIWKMTHLRSKDMKTITLALLIGMLVTFTGCNSNQHMTIWTLTGQDIDLTARVGVITENSDIGGTEVGVVAKYLTSSEISWGPEPDYVGGYLLFHLTQEVSIEDTPEASPIKDMLESLNVCPYAGLELVGGIGEHFEKVQPNWILGTKFTIDTVSNWALVAEYVDGDQQAGGVHLGIMGRF